MGGTKKCRSSLFMKTIQRIMPVMLAALILASPVFASQRERSRDVAQRIESLTDGGPYDPDAVPAFALPDRADDDARVR
jgi:hypothetical protein